MKWQDLPGVAMGIENSASASERIKLENRIAQREQAQADEGLLSEAVHSAIDLFSKSDRKSLSDLKQLSRTGGSDAEIEAALDRDHKTADWRDEVAHYTTTFAKVVPLFMGPGKGLALAAGLYGLDQVRPSTGLSMMAVDFALGATKGAATKLMLDGFGGGTAPMWQKGAVIGGGMSFLDASLTSKNWYDAHTGQWHIGDGLKNTATATAFGTGTGMVVFPIGAKLAGGVAGLGKEVFGNSISEPLLANLSMGWSFGAVSGGTGEALREITSGERISPWRIARGAALESVTDMLAAGAGYGLGQIGRGSDQAPVKAESRELTEKNTEWLKEDPQRLFEIATRAASGDQTANDFAEAMKENADIARTLTGPQIRTGLKSILLADDPSAGLDLLMTTGVMKEVLPEIAEMTGPKGEQSWHHHSEGNVWEHTQLVIDHMTERTTNLPENERFAAQLAALFHDVAKPNTQVIAPDGRISNPNHAEIGAQMTRDILTRLEVDPEITNDVVSMVQDHMLMHQTTSMKPKTLNKVLADPLIESKIRLQAADGLSSIPGTPPEGANAAAVKESQETFGSYEDFLTQKLAEFRAAQIAKAAEQPAIVTSKMLLDAGVKPGPQIGVILKGAKAAQSAGDITSVEDAGSWLAENYNVKLSVANPQIATQIGSALDALKSSDPAYFEAALKTRTTEPKGSRYENMTPEQLEAAIRSADWQPFNHPDIKAPAQGFKADLPGRLGMTPIADLPEDAPIWLIDPKGTGHWSASTRGVAGPAVDYSTLIVGPSDAGQVMYTVFPGDPLSPSPVTSLPAEIQSRLAPSGELRIPVSKAEAQSLGFDWAKIEDGPLH